MQYPGPYVPPILTVDSVIFQLVNNKLAVLLIKRTVEPFKGHLALPGGYNPAGETTTEAMARILLAKTGLDARDVPLIEQLYTFDTVARDPRGHAVSVTYLGLGRDLPLRPGPTAQDPQFVPLDKLPALPYDHADVISYAHDRLKSKITYTNAVFALLPPLFTLTQLQQAYEAILGQKLDKRNFRKKFLALQLIKPTDQYYQEGAHRPALLYTFRQQSLQDLSRHFD